MASPSGSQSVMKLFLPAEQMVDHPGGGVAVLQVAEASLESVVGRFILAGQAVEVGQRREQVFRSGQQRPRGHGLEVGVEAAQAVSVMFQIVGIEQHGSAGVGEVE